MAKGLILLFVLPGIHVLLLSEAHKRLPDRIGNIVSTVLWIVFGVMCFGVLVKYDMI